MTDLQKRIRQFIDYLGIEVKEFETQIGASNGFVGKIGDSLQPKSKKKIFDRYPALNEVWVFTGQGRMISKHTEDENVISKVEITLLENKRLKKENEDLRRKLDEIKDYVIELQKQNLDKSLSSDKNIVNDKL